MTLSQWRQRFPNWLTLILIGLGVALSLPGDTSLYIALPTHTAEAGITLAQVGLMLSANRLIRLLINTPYGLLMERIPRRAVLVPSLLGGGLANLLYTLPGFWPLLIGRLLWGIAWAGIWIGGSTAILDIATDANRGRYSGAYQIFYFSGIGGSAILAGVLTDQIGYIPGLRISALIAVLMGLVWLIFLPETRPESARHTEPAPVNVQAAAPALPAAASRLPVIIAVALLGINWLAFLGVLGATLPLLLQERIGSTITLLGLLLPLTTFTGVLSASNQFLSAGVSPLSGWLSDRLRNRWTLIVLAMAGGTLSLALIAGGQGSMIVYATLLSAVSTSVIQTQVMTVIGDAARGGQHGRMMGILNTAGDMGAAGGALLGYALLPAIGLAGIFGLMAVVLLLATPPVIWMAGQEVSARRAAKPSPVL